MTNLKVEIDRDLCNGTGECELLAPMAFKLTEEGFAIVVDADSVDDETIRLVADTCPSGAIIVSEL